jgi:hypothetical protein
MTRVAEGFQLSLERPRRGERNRVRFIVPMQVIRRKQVEGAAWPRVLDAGPNLGDNAPMHTPGSILERIGRTPKVRLGRLAAHLPVPVLGKCEFLNPGGSVKDRIALAILEDAERNRRIAPGATLIEATAGNTGMGLALMAAARGYHLVCVMPEKMSADKRAALATVGAEVVIVPNAPRPRATISRMSRGARRKSGAGF